MDLRARWILLGAAAVVLVAHSLVYNFVTDDAYISFVYSRNFAEHGELTFNLGDHVEGYTNFLWTLILGILMVPGIPPEISSRVLGTLCALGTLYLVFRATERALGRPSPWAALPSCLLACSSGFACWTSGGLETQLFTVLVAAALDALLANNLRRVAIMLALASMTRPEGPMIAAVFGVAWYAPMALDKKLPGKTELVAAAWFLALWAPWFLWRYWYYGYPFPNTYYVKATGPWANDGYPAQMRSAGWSYLWAWLWQTKLVVAAPLVGIGLVTAVIRWATPRSRLALACLGLLVFYVPYVVSVGGDFMGLHRFIMPLFVVGALAVTLGLEWIASRVHADGRVVIAVVFACAIAVPFAASQALLTRDSLDPTNLDAAGGVIDTPAFLIVYTEDRAAIGRAMSGCFHDDDLSIVGGAGAQPYFGHMRAYDVFGLVSERVAHESPRIRPRAGHTKFASEDLIMQLQPTFIFSCYSLDKTPDAKHFNCSPQDWLSRGFEKITMHVPDMRQSGEYYTFFAKKARHFECPGRVK